MKAVRFAMFAAVILFGLCAAAFWSVMQRTTNEQMARQDHLDAQGTRVVGQIIGSEATGSKSYEYSITYKFRANNRSFKGSGYVSRETYLSARDGGPIAVTYLPTDPGLSRPQGSDERERILNRRFGSLYLGVCALGLPVYLSVGGAVAVRQKARAKTNPISPPFVQADEPGLVEPRTYTMRWSSRLNELSLPALFGAGLFYFLFVVPGLRQLHTHDHIRPLAIAAALGGLCGLAILVATLAALADSFSVYAADDVRIEKRGRRTVSISWESITSAEYSGRQDNHVALHSGNGQRLDIALPVIDDSTGTLRATIEAYTKAAVQKQMDDLSIHPRVYRPWRAHAGAVLLFALLLLGPGLFVLVDAFRRHGAAQPEYGVAAIFLIFSGILALLGINCYTSMMTIGGEAIASDSLLAHVRIPFSAADEVISYTNNGDYGPVRVTTIRSGKKQISFTDSVAGYTLACRYITEHTDVKAADRAARRLPARTARQSRLMLNTMGAIFTVMFGGLEISSILDDRQALARQDRLDRVGVQTTGRITGGSHWDRNSKSSYYLDYEFTVNGRIIKKHGSVTLVAYCSTHDNDPIVVTYVPNDPYVSRPAGSDARARTTQALTTTCGILFICSFIPLALFGGAALIKSPPAES